MDEFVARAVEVYDRQLEEIKELTAAGVDLSYSADAGAGDDDGDADPVVTGNGGGADDDVEASERGFVADLAQFMFEQAGESDWLRPELVVQFARGCKWRREMARDKFGRFAEQMQAIASPPVTLDSVRSLLDTGLIRVVPGARDRRGRQVLVIRPGRTAKYGEESGERVRLLHFLLNTPEIMGNTQTQLLGFVGVLDLTDVGMSMLTSGRHLLAETSKFVHKALPARFAHMYVLNPPFFFKMLVSFLSVFVSSKMISRLRTVDNVDQLRQFIPASSLPEQLGGTQKQEEMIDEWILKKQ